MPQAGKNLVPCEVFVFNLNVYFYLADANLFLVE